MKDTEQALAYQKAKTRVKSLKAYYIMLLVYFALFVYYLIQKGDQEFLFLGPFLNGWLFSIWGIFLVLYSLYLYVPYFRNWEEKQLYKELDRIQKHQK